jgi:NADH-quinone oxidoreductase subunit L
MEDPLLYRMAFMAVLLPLAGFVVLALFGDAIKREGKADGAGLLACAMALGSFALSLGAVWRLSRLFVYQTPRAPGVGEGLRFSQPYLGLDWIDVAGFRVPLNLLLDPLSAVMILVVTGVGSLIHVYSLGYMHHDAERVRYFSYLNLFTFFMLLLVLGGNLPLMFVGWEGVGLCSYLLIGFWFKKKSATDAGNKAFIVNRVGDAGLLLGMVLAYDTLGTLDLFDIAANIGAKPAEPLGTLGLLGAIALLLFVGACGKSAQIPLHVWLPDAMEGPTPVSALIHAATMVTAGVYLVARLAPLYDRSPTAMAVVAVVGAATALMAASVALVQTDIKKVLAYSTVSQLGYMFLACGVGAFGVAIFHLFTHAFFKALLFLGSGSVIHALGGEQDMRRMGGLRRRIPWTFGTFAVGTAAIAGIPFLAGFYSKDAILAAAFAAERPVLFGVALFTAFLTAFYMARLLFLTFFGNFRGGAEAEQHVHESPWSMLAPLCLLALGSVAAGYVAIPHLVAPALHLREAHPAHFGWLPAVATLSALAGIAAAYYIYLFYPGVSERIGARLTPLRRVLEAKWGFDLLGDWIARRLVVEGSEKLLWKRVDAAVIDGAVNGLASTIAAAAQGVRFVQTGLVRGYALVILGGALALVGYLLWLPR